MAVDVLVNFDYSQATEIVLIEQARAELAMECAEYPDFLRLMEDTDTDICTRAELVGLMRSAPTRTLRLCLLTIYNFRQQLANITGRSFS